MAVSFTKKNWVDGQAGGTPVTAAELNRIETGISSLASQSNSQETDIEELRDFVSQDAKVLWQGEKYIKEGDQADLAEPVSAQKHGIVLIWSAYNVGEGALYQNYCCHFVPKWLVAARPGSGHIQLTYRGQSLIEKYVYIHDDKLTGNSTNDDSSARSEGHTVDKRQTALVAVLGV